MHAVSRYQYYFPTIQIACYYLWLRRENVNTGVPFRFIYSTENTVQSMKFTLASDFRNEPDLGPQVGSDASKNSSNIFLLPYLLSEWTFFIVAVHTRR